MLLYYLYMLHNLASVSQPRMISITTQSVMSNLLLYIVVIGMNADGHEGVHGRHGYRERNAEGCLGNYDILIVVYVQIWQ